MHGYMTVDLAIVRSILEHNLDDLLSFVATIQARMPKA